MVRPDNPQPPVQDRSTDGLLDDLSAALRMVAIGTRHSVPRGYVSHVEQVQLTHSELLRRGIDLADFLGALSRATGWQMLELLGDCVRYPAATPRVRNLDGLRIDLVCIGCQADERPDLD